MAQVSGNWRRCRALSQHLVSIFGEWPSLVRARVWGTRDRRFESGLPDWKGIRAPHGREALWALGRFTRHLRPPSRPVWTRSRASGGRGHETGAERGANGKTWGAWGASPSPSGLQGSAPSQRYPRTKGRRHAFRSALVAAPTTIATMHSSGAPAMARVDQAGGVGRREACADRPYSAGADGPFILRGSRLQGFEPVC